MHEDKKTIAIDANPTTASVAFGLALGLMPRMLQHLERESDGVFSFPENKQAEIMEVLLCAFREANKVSGAHEEMTKDKEFMAEMEELFGHFEEAI